MKNLTLLFPKKRVALAAFVFAYALVFASTGFANTTAYFFPADFNGTTQTPVDVTQLATFSTICAEGSGASPHLPGLDMVRSFANLPHCPGSSASGQLAQTVDYIFLVDDTRAMSAYLISQLQAQHALQNSGGRQIVRTTVVRFERASLPPLSILVVGEMAHRHVRTASAWLAQVNQAFSSERLIAQSEGSDPSLFILGRDSEWLVFSRPVFRPEVINYFWQGRFSPSADELRAREGTITIEGGATLQIDDTHWHLDYTPGFTSGRVYSSMTPALRERLDNLPDMTDYAALAERARPRWIPSDVWQDALAKLQAGQSGVHVYDNRSSAQTDIVMVIRNGRMGGYADSIENVERLYVLYEVIPPDTWEQYTGQSSRQAAIRWLAESNQDYNRFMRQQVDEGRTVREARSRYADHVRIRLVVTLLQAYRDVVPGGRFAAPPGAGEMGSRGLEIAMETLNQIIDLTGLAD